MSERRDARIRAPALIGGILLFSVGALMTLGSLVLALSSTSKNPLFADITVFVICGLAPIGLGTYLCYRSVRQGKHSEMARMDESKDEESRLDWSSKSLHD